MGAMNNSRSKARVSTQVQSPSVIYLHLLRTPHAMLLESTNTFGIRRADCIRHAGQVLRRISSISCAKPTRTRTGHTIPILTHTTQQGQRRARRQSCRAPPEVWNSRRRIYTLYCGFGGSTGHSNPDFQVLALIWILPRFTPKNTFF